jgi:hypothetical protein
MRRLTMRDLGATACIAAAAMLYSFQAGNVTGGELDGVRLSGGLIFLLALMACAANGQQVTEGGYARLMSIVGGSILALTIIVLITGNRPVLDVTFGLIIAMWAVTTVRHALGKHLAERPVYATQRSAWRM